MKPKILNEVKSEIKDQYLSSEKAERILSWKPKHGLEEGLKITIAWYKEFLAEQENLNKTEKKESI